MVAWQPVGIAMGIYDHCLQYCKRREQFGAPLAAFQLNQEKLARMLGTIQGMIYMGLRMSQLYTAGKLTPGHASLTKAMNSLRGREVAHLGRELLGGNGIDGSYHVARLFCDMESIYTYEGMPVWQVRARWYAERAIRDVRHQHARRGPRDHRYASIQGVVQTQIETEPAASQIARERNGWP